MRHGFFVKLPIKFTERKDWILASCPIIDVHSQGETKKKAKENLEEAISLFLKSCLERNTLDQVLKQSGFERINHYREHQSVTVPIPTEAVLSECRV